MPFTFSHIFCTHSLCITDNNHLSLNKMPTTSHVIGLGKNPISDIWNIWTTASVLNTATQSISKLSLTTHDSHINSLHSLEEMPSMLLEHWHPLIHPTLAVLWDWTNGAEDLFSRRRRGSARTNRATPHTTYTSNNNVSVSQLCILRFSWFFCGAQFINFVLHHHAICLELIVTKMIFANNATNC